MVHDAPVHTRRSRMKVFVTGATGFVGQEIVQQLHHAGHSVRLLVRKRNSRPVQEAVARCGAEVHMGNVLEAASLDGALEGMEAAIHLVGIISEVGESTFENVHARGTRNVAAAAQAAAIRRFIQMSALGTRPNAAARYHQSKWAAEELVRRSGLDYTIFRPSLIYGPRDQFVNLFARIIRFSPFVPVIGGGRARFQPVSVKAVARAFVRALCEPKSIGQCYDLCGPETFTMPELLDHIFALMRKKRFKLRVPLVLARAQAAFLEFLFQRVLKKAPPLNRDQLVMLEEDNVGDARAANELFGLRHAPFREEAARYLTPSPRPA